MEPKVSVVIPTYNVEKYVKQCLDSVLGQSLKDIEVICVDDGSEDRTLEILRGYERRDKRVKVIAQKNINAGAARNNGFSYAAGKYVIFLDADDFFEEKMLEKMFERAESTNADVVVVDSNVFDNEKKVYAEGQPFEKDMIPQREVFAGKEVDKLFLAFVGWPWDKMFLVDYLRKNELRFQEQRSTNDLFFVYAALVKAKRISVIYEVLAHHRINVKTSISMMREKSWDCAHAALVALKEWLIEQGMYSRKMQRDFANYALRHSLWHLETLKGEAQERFYDAFRGEWTKEYDLIDKKDYYFDKMDYEKIKGIWGNNYTGYLRGVIEELRNDNRAKWERIESLAQEVGAIRNEECILKNDLAEVRKRNCDLEKGLKDIKESGSYKVGLAMTSVPRKVRSVAKRVGVNRG